MDRLRLRGLLLDDTDVLLEADLHKSIKDLEVSAGGSGTSEVLSTGKDGVCGDEEPSSSTSVIAEGPRQLDGNSTTGNNLEFCTVLEPQIGVTELGFDGTIGAKAEEGLEILAISGKCLWGFEVHRH